VVVAFDPAVSYVRSRWPIDRIWRVNQPGGEPHAVLHLAAGGTYLEIRRDNDEVVFRAVELDTFTFRAALAERQRLKQAIAATGTVAPDFCLTAAIRTLFTEHLVVDVTVSHAEAIQ
jgi:hypothetical protein